MTYYIALVIKSYRPVWHSAEVEPCLTYSIEYYFSRN